MFLITSWINGIKVGLRLFWFSLVQGVVSLPLVIGVYVAIFMNYDMTNKGAINSDPKAFGIIILVYLLLIPYTNAIASRLTGYLRGDD
jgi:hypothetical protein